MPEWSLMLTAHVRPPVNLALASRASPSVGPLILSRAQRAQYRLAWAERLARNARVPTARHLTITLFGVPDTFATAVGLLTA